jgi:two-component system, chemotaxis family, protein-glutamate methylesterase/glutaminase
VSPRCRDIVVIGTSAGGVEALRRLAAALPADFGAAVFVVLHQAPDAPGVLPRIVDWAGPLPAVAARDDIQIRSGRIVVAPPGLHLVLTPDRCRLLDSPPERHHRPSIDVLFRSAALHHGSRVIGVVLTGLLDDGADGLAAVKSRGGVAVVQDPADAEYPELPRNALAATAVDYCVPLAGLADLLVELTRPNDAHRAARPTSHAA